MKKSLLIKIGIPIILLVGFAPFGAGQTNLASWSFDALLAASDAVPTASVINADNGILAANATIYLDGTNGSSSWVSMTTSPELTAFSGSTLNDPRTIPNAGMALSLANLSANGKSVIFKFSTLGYQNISLSFATRGTSTGFNTHTWDWSTDNVTYTAFGTNTANITSTFLLKTLDLSGIPSVNNASIVYIKLTLSGATSAAGNNRIENFVVSATDVAAPIPTFNPDNSATDVLVWSKPTISFNEAIRKTDGSDVTDADLASLITFKRTDASGADVAFTATIDATRKIITVTPSASLDYSQVYYLAVGPVEDVIGNESTLKSATFTTIGALTPTITVTYPNGGEVMYAGDLKTITWTTTNFDVAENVKVEVWAIDGSTGNYFWLTLEASTPNDGAYDVIVGIDATYGTDYRIKLSGVTNGASDESNGPFTVISTATTLANLKSYDLGSKIKYTGEAIITFIRIANRNQKYIQDATAGLLIDDASGVLVTTLATGDKITNLEGTLGSFTGMFQLVPTVSTVTVVSTGNTVTVPTLTIPEYTANQAQYESMLIKIPNLTFPAADGSATFAASTQYTVNDGTNNLAFFTFKAGEGISPIVGTIIPSGTFTITGLALKYNTTVEIASRCTNDFELLTGIEKTSASSPVIYPVPAKDMLTIRNISNISHVEILDAAGRVIRSANISGDSEIHIPVGDLSKGLYFLRLTTPTGKVTSKFIK